MWLEKYFLAILMDCDVIEKILERFENETNFKRDKRDRWFFF